MEAKLARDEGRDQLLDEPICVESYDSLRQLRKSDLNTKYQNIA